MRCMGRLKKPHLQLTYLISRVKEGKMNRKRKALGLIFGLMIAVSMIGPLWAAGTQKLDINKATAEQFVQLHRIGPSYAAKIVEYREKNGPFEKIEDLMNVPGIGQKTFELNKNLITVK